MGVGGSESGQKVSNDSTALSSYEVYDLNSYQAPNTIENESAATSQSFELYSCLERSRTLRSCTCTNSSNLSSDPNLSRTACSTTARSLGLKQPASRHRKPVIHSRSVLVRPVRFKGEKDDGQSSESSSILPEGASTRCIPCMCVKVASSYTHHRRRK
eukprot:scaffold20432_cov70-Phaeocystis_antarctica.AAC.8